VRHGSHRSLLALIDAQKATGIVLRAREPPVLIGAQGRGLTMPPLAPQILETFAAEALARPILTGCALPALATPSTAPNATASLPWRRAGTLTSCH